MSAFDKLDRDAQRAAFAHMSAADRVAKAKRSKPREPKLQPAKPISAAERMALTKKAGPWRSSLDEKNAVIRARRGRGTEIETRVEPHRRAATLAALKRQGYTITHDSHAKS